MLTKREFLFGARKSVFQACADFASCQRPPAKLTFWIYLFYLFTYLSILFFLILRFFRDENIALQYIGQGSECSICVLCFLSKCYSTELLPRTCTQENSTVIFKIVRYSSLDKVSVYVKWNAVRWPWLLLLLLLLFSLHLFLLLLFSLHLFLLLLLAFSFLSSSSSILFSSSFQFFPFLFSSFLFYLFSFSYFILLS